MKSDQQSESSSDPGGDCLKPSLLPFHPPRPLPAPLPGQAKKTTQNTEVQTYGESPQTWTKASCLLPVPQILPILHPSPLPAEANPSPFTQPSQIYRNQFSFPAVEDQLQAETCSKIIEGSEKVEKEMWKQREKLRLLAPCPLAMNLSKQSL